MYRRRWKPSKAQREAYRAMMEEREKLDFIRSSYPIRVGCWIKFHRKAKGDIVAGMVTKSTYRDDGQHSFTIKPDDGGRSVVVMGRNLYNSLMEHKPGEIAKDADHPLNNRYKEI